MNELFEKERDRISTPIKKFIEDNINNGFKNREGRAITKIDSINISRFVIDSKLSEIKETIIVNDFRVDANVWVQFSENGTRNNTLNLSISGVIKLSYDFEVREYSIDNLEELSIIDRSY